MKLQLFNSLSGTKEIFEPIEHPKVGVYVCGPTVYDRPHLGNARSVVIYDMLFRLLKSKYGAENVTYVRNITDVDDKINKAAIENNETIESLTHRVTGWFHDDMAALNCQNPTYEPKATDNIENIINLIQGIINNGHAYVSEGHVLFDVSSMEGCAAEDGEVRVYPPLTPPINGGRSESFEETNTINGGRNQSSEETNTINDGGSESFEETATINKRGEEVKTSEKTLPPHVGGDGGGHSSFTQPKLGEKEFTSRDKNSLAKAKNLRKNQTDFEDKLWHKLRGKQLLGYKFRRQHPIGKYIVDFACVEKNLIVEIDGGQHSENQKYDSLRTEYLNQAGYTVLRFWNFQVAKNIDAVCETILKYLNNYHYGILSGKKLEDLRAGARVEVEAYKRNPEDFVLWKPADEEDDESSKFESPWGVGRPGWHIECSAMSTSILGENFDIHGGGADLKFPHHENEIAQSCAAHPNSHYAKYWVHNGFLTVNGEKMSKSLGNFTTVRQLLDKGVHGEVIRLALLSAHYRKPLDFNDKLIEDSKKTLDKFYDALNTYSNPDDYLNEKDNNVVEAIEQRSEEAFENLIVALFDDLNFPLAVSHLYAIAKGLRSYNCTKQTKKYFDEAVGILGICQQNPKNWFEEQKKTSSNINESFINQKIDERLQAKKNKDFAKADKIRDELKDKGIILKDTPQGTQWQYQ